MIKLKTLLDESFGGMLAAAIRANNAITPHKNKFKVDPKQVKVGDELEWYGKDKDPRVTGTISKIDSKGIEITNLKAVGTKKMDYGLKGVTINANTKYFYFGSYNKMLNHWKLKDSQDTDQNNNGYPDSTEGSTNNEFTDYQYESLVSWYYIENTSNYTGTKGRVIPYADEYDDPSKYEGTELYIPKGTKGYKEAAGSTPYFTDYEGNSVPFIKKYFKLNPNMTNETLRMQMLDGIITEG